MVSGVDWLCLQPEANDWSAASGRAATGQSGTPFRLARRLANFVPSSQTFGARNLELKSWNLEPTLGYLFGLTFGSPTFA